MNMNASHLDDEALSASLDGVLGDAAGQMHLAGCATCMARRDQLAGARTALAGAPVEIAPAAQGLWMRGASLTMLHQPTPRTDLAIWAEDTTTVIDMIEAKAVVISDPFMVEVLDNTEAYGEERFLRSG